MEKMTESLRSGTSYSFYEFMKCRAISIPDLQRDYCWAERKVTREHGKSLVECYVEDLIRAANTDNSELKMGLLYGYEYPRGMVQLCDGQQRLTTLFLICGVCVCFLESNGATDTDIFKESKGILSFNGTSRLQYAVRDSTLSFLNNLVDSECFGRSVTEAGWYCSEYDKDPSVRNMVSAIVKIGEKINNAKTAERLLDFILHKISFLYFDMQSREYSEEQYVILNTTGKLLTATEHIKPQLLGKLVNDNKLLEKYSEEWESWEQFIWEHRPHENDNFTVDEWFDRLLTIFYLADCAFQEEEAAERLEEYSKYQKILQGELKYDFPHSNQEDAVQTLDKIQGFFSVAKFIDENNVPVSSGLSQTTDATDILLWQYISSDKWNYLANLQQAVAVFSVLSAIIEKNYEPSILKSWAFRILEFAWVQAQYTSKSNTPNSDVAKFLAFIAGLDIEGESVYQIAQRSELFSEGLRNRKFPLLMNMDIKNTMEIAPIELALQRVSHLHTSKGQISYIFDVLSNVNEENINRLAENLSKTTENITTQTRRALLTYGEYFIKNWQCKWGVRYDFAFSTEFFYDQLHKKDAPKRNVIYNFVKDIALQEDVETYLGERIDLCRPVIETQDKELNKIIEIIYDNPKYFNLMNHGRLAIGSSGAFAMKGSSQSNGDIRILDPQRDALTTKTFETIKTLDNNWELENGFTLKKGFEIKKNNKTICVQLSGDYHYNNEQQIQFTPYVNISCNGENWESIKDTLVKLYPKHEKIDEKKIHLQTILPSVNIVANAMIDYYSRLTTIRINGDEN